MNRPDQPGAGGDDAFRCGYVALIGRPNVGKSTLLNRILGQKLSIVTAKPQTTRQRIAGIKTTGQGQVVYIDTPGIHLAAKRALNRYMNRIAQAALHDVDLVLFMIEADRWTRQDEHVARSLEDVSAPVILVVNKIDRVPDKSRLLGFLRDEVDSQRFQDVLLVAAKTGDGVDDLEGRVLQSLPFSRPFYDEDQWTDRSERFLAAELIREQLMLRLHQELPYSLTVEIEEFKRTQGILRIGAIIWVERNSQKQIVIGKGGNVLKQVGSHSRRALEELFEEKVFLRSWVKVSRDWSDNEKALRQFGFDESS
ncbi:MAG: GTPase Era [Xanthomonadales bacterium]|nr:GTPase Era [Gammaproteobacteria bacterium]MBT8063449.1 GTPase Era [Gammaproteobacteria bacterium]NNJ63965.1 GTPase Era [Xanthomonadales bacterium]NNK33853.1 GTPase Era [Xanthomonadales bacterium]